MGEIRKIIIFYPIYFRPVFTNPKSIQASVVLLERMAVILEKSSEKDMRQLILPLLFHSLESNMSQIQVGFCSLVTINLNKKIKKFSIRTET